MAVKSTPKKATPTRSNVAKKSNPIKKGTKSNSAAKSSRLPSRGSTQKKAATKSSDTVKLSKEAKSGTQVEARSEAVSSILKSWNDDGPKGAPDSPGKSAKGAEAASVDVGSAADGLEAAGKTQNVRDAARTARRNEKNRPGKGPNAGQEIRAGAKKLQEAGHEVKATRGDVLNTEQIERQGGGPKTEVGPDGKSRIKKGEYAPGAYDKAPGYRVEVKGQPILAERVHGASNAGGGQWTGLRGTTEGLTKKEIQKKLALKDAPTHRQAVVHNPGAKLNKSVIGAQEGLNQPGKLGVQFNIPERSSVNEFGASKKLNDLEVHAERFAKGLRSAGKVFKPIGALTDSVELASAFKQDGYTIGQKTRDSATNVVGSWAGAAAGAKYGGATGATLGSVVPGVGTVFGGVTGSFIGGLGGAYYGSDLSSILNVEGPVAARPTLTRPKNM